MKINEIRINWNEIKLNKNKMKYIYIHIYIYIYEDVRHDIHNSGNSNIASSTSLFGGHDLGESHKGVMGIF